MPGVYAQKKWGADTRLSIRGSGIGNSSHNRGTLLAQDGVPFNEADGFGDFQLIDPQIARYTEVYKGGNALRFGGALLGGAINLVTPRAATREPKTCCVSKAGPTEPCADTPRPPGPWATGTASRPSPPAALRAGAL